MSTTPNSRLALRHHSAHNGGVIRKRVLARGEVQGVGFRFHARAEAQQLGLGGYARNRPDGSVELEVEGREASVSRMLHWLESGPRYAVVTALEVSDVAATGESDFQISD
ncbi:acylphosphatase [Cryobacterium sp. Y82]|uniref:acylphosphatase n=1 Tax=Cryobacterium sp. Y82 TaxID=2045017 RepID=UPI001E28B35F|nr:acylphosphatase [Cryobacterium sp. Y82]